MSKKDQQEKPDWQALRKEYDTAVRQGGFDGMQWCVQKARELNMSYGMFVHRLRR